MSRKYSSVSLETEVVGSLTTTATSIVVANATNLLGGINPASITSTEDFIVVLDPETSSEEIVRVTAVSSNTLTAVRGYDGSTGKTHTSGANATTFSGAGTELITTNGRSLGFPITINGTGTTSLAGALTLTGTLTATLQAGTLDLNGFTLTSPFFDSSFSTSRTIAFNGGQIAISGNGGNPQLNIQTATNFFWTGTPYFNLTYTGATGTRVISLGSTTQGTFGLGNAFDISVNGTSGIRLGTGTDIIAVQGFMNNLDLTGMTFTFANRTRTIFGNITIPATGGSYESGSFVNTMVNNSSKTIDTNGRSTFSTFTFQCARERFLCLLYLMAGILLIYQCLR